MFLGKSFFLFPDPTPDNINFYNLTDSKMLIHFESKAVKVMWYKKFINQVTSKNINHDKLYIIFGETKLNKLLLIWFYLD